MTSPATQTFTCEQCRYPLTGLSPQGLCPECGRSVHESTWLRGFLKFDPTWLTRTRGILILWASLTLLAALELAANQAGPNLCTTFDSLDAYYSVMDPIHYTCLVLHTLLMGVVIWHMGHPDPSHRYNGLHPIGRWVALALWLSCLSMALYESFFHIDRQTSDRIYLAFTAAALALICTMLVLAARLARLDGHRSLALTFIGLAFARVLLAFSNPSAVYLLFPGLDPYPRQTLVTEHSANLYRPLPPMGIAATTHLCLTLFIFLLTAIFLAMLNRAIKQALQTQRERATP